MDLKSDILKILKILQSSIWKEKIPNVENHSYVSHEIVTKNKSKRLLLIQKHTLLMTYELFNKYCNDNVESVVYWYGKESIQDNVDIVISAVIPQTSRNPGNYSVSEKSIEKMGQITLSKSLVCLAQFHTHPGYNTEHSSYDDVESISSRKGFLSLVAPNYGCDKKTNLDNVSVHESWNHKWYVLSNSAKKDRIIILDDIVDLR